MAEIKILKVIESPHHLLYEYKLPSFEIDKTIPDICYDWHLNEETFNTFKNAPKGKMFESDIFKDMFCLIVYPNGLRKDQSENVRLFCQICAFPPGVTSILVNLEWSFIYTKRLQRSIGIPYTKEIVKDRKLCHHMETVKYGPTSNFGWPAKLMTMDHVYRGRHHKHCAFRVEIEFIALYDANDQAIWEREETPHKSSVINPPNKQNEEEKDETFVVRNGNGK